MTLYPSQLADRFIVRFPDGLRDEIKTMAAVSERSMNAEIVFHLRKAVAAAKEEGREGGTDQIEVA